MLSTFDIGAASLILTKSQCRPLAGWTNHSHVQQVINQLIVDLKKGHPDGELHIVISHQ